MQARTLARSFFTSLFDPLIRSLPVFFAYHSRAPDAANLSFTYSRTPTIEQCTHPVAVSNTPPLSGLGAFVISSQSGYDHILKGQLVG